VRKSLWKEIAHFAQSGGAVLLTTHYLEEAEALATRIDVIHRGQILMSGRVEDIKKKIGYNVVRFRSSREISWPIEVQYSRQGDLYRVLTPHSDELIRELVQKFSFSDLEVHAVTLEEAFLELLK